MTMINTFNDDNTHIMCGMSSRALSPPPAYFFNDGRGGRLPLRSHYATTNSNK